MKEKLSPQAKQSLEELKAVLKNRPTDPGGSIEWENQREEAISKAETFGVSRFLIVQEELTSMTQEEQNLYLKNIKFSEGLAGLKPIEYTTLVKQFGKK